MPDDQASGREELAELRERVGRLELQVAKLAQGRSEVVPPEAPSAETTRATRTDTDDTVATVFTRVAMLSFVLLGALILRTLTQQHILAAGLGTLLGFVYAGHLIVLSVLPGRLGRLARETSLFQSCGVALALSIVLESSLRAQTLGRPAAMLLVAFFAAVALAVAIRHRKVVLAATALAGGPLALVALGLEPDGLGLQLLSLVLFAAAGAALSWRRAWSLLRPLAFLLFLLLVSVGFALAHKQALGRAPLLACAAAFWGVIAVQHLVAFRRLGWSAAWLPLSTGWLAFARFERDSVRLCRRRAMGRHSSKPALSGCRLGRPPADGGVRIRHSPPCSA